MKKSQSPLDKISQNFKNLIPYVGVLFVVSGIIGLLFIQKPLQTSQDTRGEAYTGGDYVLKNCNETCTTNRDCAINLKCYQKVCRLATNPDSSICSAITETNTEPKISKTDTIDETNSATTEAVPTNKEPQETQPPANKGDDLLLDPDLEFKQQQNAITEKKIYDESYQADETLLDLFKNLVLNSESRLPFFIMLIGVIILVLSILVALLTRLRKTKYTISKNSKEINRKINVKSYTVQPGRPPRNSATKDLLKTLENKPKA